MLKKTKPFKNARKKAWKKLLNKNAPVQTMGLRLEVQYGPIHVNSNLVTCTIVR